MVKTMVNTMATYKELVFLVKSLTKLDNMFRVTFDDDYGIYTDDQKAEFERTYTELKAELSPIQKSRKTDFFKKYVRMMGRNPELEGKFQISYYDDVNVDMIETIKAFIPLAKLLQSFFSPIAAEYIRRDREVRLSIKKWQLTVPEELSGKVSIDKKGLALSPGVVRFRSNGFVQDKSIANFANGWLTRWIEGASLVSQMFDPEAKELVWDTIMANRLKKVFEQNKFIIDGTFQEHLDFEYLVAGNNKDRLEELAVVTEVFGELKALTPDDGFDSFIGYLESGKLELMDTMLPIAETLMALSIAINDNYASRYLSNYTARKDVKTLDNLISVKENGSLRSAYDHFSPVVETTEE